jgi:Crp-like helix-turn-helix domain
MDVPIIAAELFLAGNNILTTVHVNRVLRQLRTRDLIAIRQRRVEILDHAGLEELAQFAAGYLEGEGGQPARRVGRLEGQARTEARRASAAG